jgi:arsenate reductase
MTTTPQVLFVCVHNAGRSQMAAALLGHYAASASTSPPSNPSCSPRHLLAELIADPAAHE